MPLVRGHTASWLLEERLTLPILLGAVAVVAGIFVGALHPTRLKEATIPAQCGPDVMVRQDLLEVDAEAAGER